MSNLVSLAASGVSLYQSLVAKPSLVQFQTARGDTIVQFDATLSETYSHQAKPTDFPIESGSTISDHMVRAPIAIDMTCLVTDSPMQTNIALQALSVATSSILPALGTQVIAQALSTWQVDQSSTSPSRAAYAKLVRMCGVDTVNPPIDPQPFTLVCKLGTFENMVISDLSVPRDDKTGQALIFQCKLTRLTVVNAQTIDISVLDQPGLAAMNQNVGDKQGEFKLVNTFDPGKAAGLKAVGEGAK